MTPDEFGQLIGATVVRTSEKEFPEVHRHIGRDQAATRANLPIAMAWVAQTKIEQLLDASSGPTCIRMMLAYVMKHVMEITGWAYETMRTVLENRLDGYDEAVSDGNGQPVLNITNYFVACCEKMRHNVQYNQIIPDPDEVESLGGAVNQDALAQIRQLRRDRDCATYSLDIIETMKVGITILSIGAGVEGAVEECC